MIDWLVQTATERMNAPGTRLPGDICAVYMFAALPIVFLWMGLDVMIVEPVSRRLGLRAKLSERGTRRFVLAVRVGHMMPYALFPLILGVKIVMAVQDERDVVERLLGQAGLIGVAAFLGYAVYQACFRAKSHSRTCD
ncbi:MAG: hypothetical protein K2Y21_09825 [Phycisphaerales bacterium]|nr:hypothetical protein [Phycisphaerales bacterium]